MKVVGCRYGHLSTFTQKKMTDEDHDSVGRVQIIRGSLFPSAKWCSKQNIEDAMDYVPRDDDLIVTSYPKTGTTWLQYIILQVMSEASFFPSFDDVTYKIVPIMEMAGTAAVEALIAPRIYKTHIPYNLVQKNFKSKYIYIYRHPEDTVVSFYHFRRNVNIDVIKNFDQFVEDFVTGRISYGNYFQHVLSFYEHREDPNLLMVSYEKLHANRKEEIVRIAKFLGDEYHARLLENDETLNKIIKHTSFDYMKKYLTVTHTKKKLVINDTESNENTVNFFRKGIVGDGKNTLTEIQRQRIKSAAGNVLKGTSILDAWYAGEN